MDGWMLERNNIDVKKRRRDEREEEGREMDPTSSADTNS